MQAVPPGFLFRLTFRCRYVAEIPRQTGKGLLDLGPECRLDDFSAVNGRAGFADIRMAWNQNGLAFQAEVPFRPLSSRQSSTHPRTFDQLRLWIDTRDVRQNHRATQYCHSFHVLFTGSGKEEELTIKLRRIPRAAEHPDVGDPALAPLVLTQSQKGYRLELFLPKVYLRGYEPEINSRLGLFYLFSDEEWGTQIPLLTSEFPFDEDPSLWHTLELVR